MEGNLSIKLQNFYIIQYSNVAEKAVFYSDLDYKNRLWNSLTDFNDGYN